MNSLPEQEPDQDSLQQASVTPAEPVSSDSKLQAPEVGNAPLEPLPPEEPLLFQSFTLPEPPPPSVRIPHLGHLGLLLVLGVFGLLVATIITRSALYFHLFGISTIDKAVTDIHYTLGSEAILYLWTFISCLIVFPLVWRRGFFAGLHWNGATALHQRKRMFGTATVCFVLALTNGLLMPGPSDAPIDKIFRSPGAAWMLFAFGVTFAPFFEEILFRGFLLPAVCTAWDWAIERSTGKPAPPLDPGGNPQWSMFAMVGGAFATSVPFAAMHAAQTGYSLGPFLLLICVSLALCWARLSTRSLAASVLVHASYNFLLFSLMLLGTSGFRHLDKM